MYAYEMKFSFSFFSIFLFFSFSVVFFSCATQAPIQNASPKTEPPQKPTPSIPANIMGKGLLQRDDLAEFLMASNKDVKPAFAKELAGFYVAEADAEGVNHDVAFSQMCLETGYLRFGNLVTRDMNNFCGLGAIGKAHPGERFPDIQTGVRAHIQHLKGYATEEPLNNALVDPRYRWVKKGSSPTVTGLSGKWASDPDYASKINGILTRLYDRSFGNKG